MTAPRKPQDRKPKAPEQPKTFTFDHEDITHTLPPVESVAALVPGRTMRDAVMDGEEGQLRLAFFMLEKLEDADDAIDALYSKPAPEMLSVVQSWMTFKPAGGVSLGE
jgi:hypothetical protein